MRRLRSLDAEIARTERRLEARRDDLNLDLFSCRVRARRAVASPKVLLGAVVAGFLIDRLGRLKPRRVRSRERGGAGSGIIAGLAAAALRSVLANPQMWQTLREAWARRRGAMRTSPALPPPV